MEAMRVFREGPAEMQRYKGPRENVFDYADPFTARMLPACLALGGRSIKRQGYKEDNILDGVSVRYDVNATNNRVDHVLCLAKEARAATAWCCSARKAAARRWVRYCGNHTSKGARHEL
jgi:hypothetical protein